MDCEATQEVLCQYKHTTHLDQMIQAPRAPLEES